ncbi:hypothetical protein BN1723_020907 [Verticillium longisporum]|uniref:Uncharacterized protein n=1 Tax=Verticillium longisporum TaxID=100787 RepID=A0A0G4KJC8_VERLO|nr:hypothetical protein BN1723_020907 [Verticillium longisporum]
MTLSTVTRTPLCLSDTSGPTAGATLAFSSPSCSASSSSTW